MQQFLAGARRLSAAIAVFVSLAIGVLIAGFQSRPSQTDGLTSSKVLTSGNVDGAMAQCREIMDILRANEWDSTQVPFELQLLPDGKLSHRADYRDGRTGMFVFPEDGGPVVFYSDLYIDPRVSYSAGDKATTDPKGFFLVGYRNGDIRKVSMETVRMAPVPGQDEVTQLTFPGMKGYKKDLPLYPLLQLRKGSRTKR